MRSRFALAVSFSLSVSLAAPVWAGSLDIYEASLGGPDVTAQFPTGSGLIAEIVYDASSAEGGNLEFGASEIEILPLGDAMLVAFACQISGCTEEDYTFTPGGAGEGSLLIYDPTDLIVAPMIGVFPLGDITWDSLTAGSLFLAGCNYSSPYGNPQEHTCDPFTLAQTPEPGTGALLGFALVALAWTRRPRC